MYPPEDNTPAARTFHYAANTFTLSRKQSTALVHVGSQLKRPADFSIVHTGMVWIFTNWASKMCFRNVLGLWSPHISMHTAKLLRSSAPRIEFKNQTTWTMGHWSHSCRTYLFRATFLVVTALNQFSSSSAIVPTVTCDLSSTKHAALNWGAEKCCGPEPVICLFICIADVYELSLPSNRHVSWNNQFLHAWSMLLIAIAG